MTKSTETTRSGKPRVALVFGGRSVEHEVSVQSATCMLEALDPERYDVIPIAIDHYGRWHAGEDSLPLDEAVHGEVLRFDAVPGASPLVGEDDERIAVDVFLPIVHGTGGEDGKLQSLFELSGLPYVGSGVLGSSLQMDKDVTKRLLRAEGIAVVPWVALDGQASRNDPRGTCERILKEFDLPVFVKPNAVGSSVGISKVKTAEELAPALSEAARYDTKILVERAIDAREIEVAVLGGDPPEASIPGEIRSHREFYDYRAKYEEEGSELLIPAPVSDAESKNLRKLALDAFRFLEGDGMARVDFLMDRTSGEIFINEVNSLPGFTKISMFPRMWIASGKTYAEILDRLIELAFERHRRVSALESSLRRS